MSSTLVEYRVSSCICALRASYPSVSLPCGLCFTISFSNNYYCRVQLEDDDEFIILGCDGIWDCLSNEQAVDYVRRRIHSQTPTEIGVEMLDDILSTDPRVTQGIGGDNMTVMIIDLQPHSRSYRTTSSSSCRYRRGGHHQGDDGGSNGGSHTTDCDDISPVL